MYKFRFVTAFLAISIIASGMPIERTAYAETHYSYSRQEVKAFVDSVALYARSVPRDRAFKRFNGPANKIARPGLYLFAIDHSGVMLAHGGDPLLIGKNLYSLKDPNGVFLIREIIDRSKKGSGWVAYIWHNPENGGKMEPKLTYVRRVGNNWCVGAGMYGHEAKKLFNRPSRGFR